MDHANQPPGTAAAGPVVHAAVQVHARLARRTPGRPRIRTAPRRRALSRIRAPSRILAAVLEPAAASGDPGPQPPGGPRRRDRAGTAGCCAGRAGSRPWCCWPTGGAVAGLKLAGASAPANAPDAVALNHALGSPSRRGPRRALRSGGARLSGRQPGPRRALPIPRGPAAPGQGDVRPGRLPRRDRDGTLAFERGKVIGRRRAPGGSRRRRDDMDLGSRRAMRSSGSAA